MSNIIEFINSIREFFFEIKLTTLIYLFSFTLVFLCFFMLKKIFQLVFIVLAFLFILTCYKETFNFIANPLLKNFQVVAYNDSDNKKLRDSSYLTNKKLNCIKNHQLIVVLGARLHHSGLPSLIGQDRVLTAIELLKSGQLKHGIPIVFSGAITNKFINKSEAQSMQQFFLNMSANFAQNIDYILEEKSRNTFQNAKNIKDTLVKMGLSQKIILVTSSFHMYRSQKIFEKLGFDVCPVAAPSLYTSHNMIFDIKNAENLWYITKEYLSILIYYSKSWLEFNDI